MSDLFPLNNNRRVKIVFEPPSNDNNMTFIKENKNDI
jgi:hypothetical protein